MVHMIGKEPLHLNSHESVWEVTQGSLSGWHDRLELGDAWKALRSAIGESQPVDVSAFRPGLVDDEEIGGVGRATGYPVSSWPEE